MPLKNTQAFIDSVDSAKLPFYFAHPQISTDSDRPDVGPPSRHIFTRFSWQHGCQCHPCISCQPQLDSAGTLGPHYSRQLQSHPQHRGNGQLIRRRATVRRRTSLRPCRSSRPGPCLRSYRSASNHRQGGAQSLVPDRGREFRHPQSDRLSHKVLLCTLKTRFDDPPEALIVPGSSPWTRPVPGDQGKAVQDFRAPSQSKTRHLPRHNRRRRRTSRRVQPEAPAPLLANASIDDLLKRVFLHSLKPTIVTAITGSLYADFDTVVAAADKAWTAASAPAYDSATVSVISGPSNSSPQRGRCGNHSGRQRGSRPSGQIESLSLCHFHKKFGDSARKCAQGCSLWSKNRPRDTPATRVFHVEEALDGEGTNVGALSEN